MRIPMDQMRALSQRVFRDTLQAPADIAEVATEVLVDADSRGIHSHGVAALPYYVGKWQQGQIVPRARIELITETSTTAVFAGHQAIGHYASREVMKSAIEKSGKTGVGSAVIRNSTHNGAISAYTIQAARSGMIGIAATSCAPHVAPHGGRLGLHGTNPISYALPRGERDPLVFDFSTGHSAAKMKKQARESGQVPAGRLLDAEGNPTTDPSDLQGGWILPVAGHVGFGFALLVDVLTAALADSPIGQQMPRLSETSGPYDGSFFCLAIDPRAFTGMDRFAGRLETLIGQIESAPAQDPGQPVRWPGKQGWSNRRESLAAGVHFNGTEWKDLLTQLQCLGVNVNFR